MEQQSLPTSDDDVDIFTACIFPHSTAADETSAAATEQSDQRLVTFAIPTPFTTNNLDDEAHASWSMPDKKKHQENPTTTTSTNQFQKVLTNIESWINCVPLAVDLGSPLNDNNTVVGGVEKRQDDSHPAATNFTKREVTEFSYMAEREAIINGDIVDPTLHNQHKQHHQQPPKKTTSNESETVANLKGVGDTYLLQLAHQTAWNLNIDNAIVDSGTTPKSRNGDISNGRKMDLDDGVAAEAIANKVSSQVNNGDVFSENDTDNIPGGLWKLLPDEMSDEENNNMVKSHDMMEFSLGADSSSSAEQPQNINEDDYDPILAAQLAVSNAMSPNSMNDRYWMDEEDVAEEDKVIDEGSREKIVKRDDVVEHIREEHVREYKSQEVNLSFNNEDDIYPENSVSSFNQDSEKTHNYTTDKEANKHFDEIISSFELSLTRNSVVQGRQQTTRRPPSPRHSNKALSYKKKDTGGSVSSTFLEDTLMGRKLNHTPPASPLGSAQHTSYSDDILSRAQKMVNNANEALDSLHKDDCTEEESQGENIVNDNNLDELELDDSKDDKEEVPPGEVDEDMFPNLKVDSKDGGENQDGLPSFDSSVNWDGLAYSMSEHNEDAKSDTSEPASVDGEEVNEKEIANSSSELSEDNPSIDQQEEHQEEVKKPQRDTGVALKYPSVVPPSPQPPYYSSVDLTPRAWDRIEQIKKRHDKIRTSVAGSPSQEENIEPSSPNTPLSIAHRPKEHTSVYTPRTQSKIDMEVQERIEKMRLQHQLNMDKMRVCLGDMNKNDDDCKDTTASTAAPSTDNTSNTNDDDSRLLSNTGRRYNTKRFEKAKLRYSSYRNSSSTPSVHDSKFNFDDTETKVPLSPSEKLMLENKALEEEMRQIRLLSPRSAASKKDILPAQQTSSPYTLKGLSVEVVDTNDKISNLISDVKGFLEAQQNY